MGPVRDGSPIQDLGKLKENQNFNNLLYALVGPVKARLEKYDTVESCGKWNARLTDDLRADYEFEDSANRMHDAAMSTQFAESPVMDCGGYIRSIEIEIGKRISIRFDLSFLSPKYFYSPSKFTLTLDPNNRGTCVAEYGCGIQSEDGEFIMDLNSHCDCPDDPSQWAFHLKHRFGDHGLERWIDK